MIIELILEQIFNVTVFNFKYFSSDISHQAYSQDQDQDSLLVKRRNDNHSPLTTYNVLLRYLAFVNRCYCLLPIMLKIFDLICQLADDFYEKSIFSHILVRFYPSKSIRAFSLLLLTICKWQFSVSGQIFFNRADKNKRTVCVLCLIFFGHALLYEWH